MKNKVIKYVVLGFPIGVAIGFYISVLISGSVGGNGSYYPCAPQFIAAAGSELIAVALQMTLCGVIGAAFAGASVVWQMDNWGLLKQTAIYFLITAGTMIPCAWGMYWMEHTLGGFLSYLGIFLGTFAAFWVSGYFTTKRVVKKMNDKLNAMKNER